MPRRLRRILKAPSDDVGSASPGRTGGHRNRTCGSGPFAAPRRRRQPLPGRLGTSPAGIDGRRDTEKSRDCSIRRRRRFPRRLVDLSRSRAQRSSCSTLCCDWLASASADTAIDWRVDSAWLLAASSLVSASVRLDEPVCSTLITFFEKSWRICTIDRLEPKAEASDRSELLALARLAMTLLVAALSMKSVPGTRLERPRLAASKLTPVMLRIDLPVSLKVSFSVSPPSRLMPLNEASWAVVVIWAMM